MLAFNHSKAPLRQTATSVGCSSHDNPYGGLVCSRVGREIPVIAVIHEAVVSSMIVRMTSADRTPSGNRLLTRSVVRDRWHVGKFADLLTRFSLRERESLTGRERPFRLSVPSSIRAVEEGEREARHVVLFNTDNGEPGTERCGCV